MSSEGKEPTEDRDNPGLYLALISIHGLIRGESLELGRDADTGGQTLYVVELARALADRPDIRRIDLLTRRVVDPRLSDDYARPLEVVSDRARIVRIDCGPEEYIPKEQLWDHLDSFVDNAMAFFADQEPKPDLIHSHYADAGYAGVRLSSLLGLPLLFTGHSLGRVKRRRLLASGLTSEQIEQRYSMTLRIEAEEETLAAAELVIVSTANEIEQQYELYDHYQPGQMRVIPPGTDLSRFRPPEGNERDSVISRELDRFLTDPDKPLVLALARPDERKNLVGLIEAYGASEELRQAANLVVVAGNRDDLREMEGASARVLLEILLTIDSNDLYGEVAYPKRHRPEDVAVLYRLAALSRGVFINPALTEPFGLTLIEAAASGLPIVATEDGGPRDIVANCSNGLLIDPLEPEAMVSALLEVLADGDTWQTLSKNGLRGVREHYSWSAHVGRYTAELQPILHEVEPRPEPELQRRPMIYHDRALFTDLDQNLLPDRTSLAGFVTLLRENRKRATFGIATGRRLDSALKAIRKFGIPLPDVLITSVGTEIHYAPRMTPDRAWSEHIDHMWTPRALRRVLSKLPGLKLQPRSELSRFKLSYLYDADQAPSYDEILAILRQHDQSVNAFLSFGQYLDITPIRASKGFALRWFAEHWEIPLERVLAAGGSGTDEDMIRGNTLAVVVANRHGEELSQLTDLDRIFFADKPHAAGILEAIEHYDFFGDCREPIVS
jgi:sucrose-phosphate synthase